MKRIIISILLILITFSACKGSTGYSLYYDTSDIQSVEIVEVFDDPDSASQLLAEYEVNYVLQHDEITRFIGLLSNAKVLEYWNDPQESIRDHAIMVHYTNGTTEILSTTGCGLFRGNIGDYNRYYFDEDSFNTLIESFISE